MIARHSRAAFPYFDPEINALHTGMDLRDYFAAKVMQAAMTGAVLPGLAEDNMPKETESALRLVSTASYRVADAMIAAREVKS